MSTRQIVRMLLQFNETLPAFHSLLLGLNWTVINQSKIQGTFMEQIIKYVVTAAL